MPTKFPRRSVASTLAPARSFLICESVMTRLIQKLACASNVQATE